MTELANLLFFCTAGMKFSLESLLEGAAQRDVPEVDEPAAKRARTEAGREIAPATAPSPVATAPPPRLPQGGAVDASATRPGGTAAEGAPPPEAPSSAGPIIAAAPTAQPVASAGPSITTPAEGTATAGADLTAPPPVITHRCSVIRDKGLAETVMEYASTARDRRARGGRDYADALLGILPQLFTVSPSSFFSVLSRFSGLFS